ncbi:hypothetical protein DBR06_SOUSAS13510064 [Sousa chinensis]|uniref:VWFA domain-containing protein n=1 Tax=Sousa chinensis TaxID=103600 RepID=A0A484GUY1_SOUCH|nr:hypothetical protein DBR06_SOUSAS13510064 [Sousa chinensis]
MESGGPWMPSPGLFLLLLLPPPLLSGRSFQHSIPNWRNLHHLDLGWRTIHRYLSPDWRSFHRGTNHHKSKAKKLHDCNGVFDLYFVLDASDSVSRSWDDICDLVEKLLKRFTNPKLRISLITYSSYGSIVLKLTSNRNEIKHGLKRLRDVVPSGHRNMQAGLRKWKWLYLAQTTCIETADKARKMGATVYCVGVKDFEEDQLLEIADSPHHVFAVDQGFKALKYIIEPLGTKSCIEITAVEPSSVCTGDENELMISGKGFNNAKKKDEVICRFKFSDKQLFDIKAESVKDTSITCPGVKIEEPDQEVFVEVSLNNGVSFINNNVSITSKNCASTREARLDDRNAPPAAQQPPEEPRSSPPPQFTPYVNPLYFCALIPALLLFLLMLWCIWWLCRRKTIKEPPPVQKPERELPDKDADSVFSSSEPEETCQMSCPTVIVPCGCQGGRMKRMELPLRLWVREPSPGICREERPRRGDLELMSLQTILSMGKCLNFALMKPHCGQLHCSPKVCLQPSQECFSVNSCCSRCQYPPPVCSRLPSRMQPLISPPARPCCGATLSLQPP